jgi:hypothetical protein
MIVATTAETAATTAATAARDGGDMAPHRRALLRTHLQT